MLLFKTVYIFIAEIYSAIFIWEEKEKYRRITRRFRQKYEGICK